MAQIIKKSSNLERDYKAYRDSGFKVIKYGIAGLIGALLGIGISFIGNKFYFELFGFLHISFLGFIVLLVSVIIMIIHFLVAASYFSEAEILKRGLIGENETADIISKLPNEYVAFQNLVIKFEDRISEMDLVVLGPTGIFIIETKNRNGIITGSFDSREWTQHKIGRGGTPYENKFYSPVKQVSTHIYRLAHYLKENGARVHINGVVYFSNPEATLNLVGEAADIPVFVAANGGKTALLSHILSGSGNLTDEYIKNVCKLLKNN